MKEEKEKALKYELGKGNPIITELPNNKTKKQYTKHIDLFCTWAADQGMKRRSQLIRLYGTMTAAVQSYADYLIGKGYTASTIHSYLAGVCRATGISLSEIEKPKRTTSENTRSRTAEGRNRRADQEERSGRFDRLLDFQRAVGIRRNEIVRLTGSDFVYDESGQPCVYVRKGKGGKPQLQVIFPEDANLIRGYFQGKAPDERIFSESEMKNHLDLHGIRHEHAKDCYTYYASLSAAEREELIDRLKARYIRFHKGPAKVEKWISQIDKDGGRYRLRGATKAHAIEKGLPVVYDRLALLATSVFHLSHWRLDVTIGNYLTAV